MTDEYVLFKTATTDKEFEDGKNLFQQYANSLDLDLGFQDFSNELKLIDKQYNKPKGTLLLAYKNDIAIGCAGIREIDNNTAELKRMYVEPEYRKYKIGARLLALAIEIAKELNYKSIRLDTLPTMIRAQELYQSFGFYEIPSYRFNPVSGTVFMEKQLK
ncbi:MAG TPA: GNAT family N-acetyltransferase [Parafilimonas sp.]|nr:GNAT family N-acetyltransferase [Parafilimonas sp.]